MLRLVKVIPTQKKYEGGAIIDYTTDNKLEKGAMKFYISNKYIIISELYP